MWVLSDDLHKELAKFLDLPKHVKNYTVTLHRNHPVKIEMVFLPEKYGSQIKHEENTYNNKNKTQAS